MYPYILIDIVFNKTISIVNIIFYNKRGRKKGKICLIMNHFGKY